MHVGICLLHLPTRTQFSQARKKNKPGGGRGEREKLMLQTKHGETEYRHIYVPLSLSSCMPVCGFFPGLVFQHECSLKYKTKLELGRLYQDKGLMVHLEKFLNI